MGGERTRIGMAIGGSLQLSIAAYAFVQIEVIRLDRDIAHLTRDRDDAPSLEYIEVPVLAGFAMGDGPEQPYLLAGPYVARPLDSAIECKQGQGSETCGDDIAKLEYGAIIGLGGSFDHPSGSRVIVEGRLEVGMTDLLPKGDGASTRNLSVGVMLGYYL